MKIYIILLCFGVIFGCATQQDLIILADQIYAVELRTARLEKSNAELERQNAASEANRAELKKWVEQYGRARSEKDQSLREQSAGINAGLDALREDLNRINGKLAESTHFLKQQIAALSDSGPQKTALLKELENTAASNKDRLEKLEKYLNLESSPRVESNIPPKAEIKKDLPQKELYMAAKQAFDKADYETAREGFQEYLKRFPKADSSDNAQFWIGEIYYRGKWYEKAILEYQKVIEQFPKANKVPASLLKQGFAFFNLGDKSNARLILNELINKHPRSREAKIANQKLKEF
ncbi:MAG: tol-pal system protein YbgF [Desulfobacterales bacterium]|nr:tol-pal system protein YbgF [Desulfobacterales bacterium]